jgi:high-affinity iron transporter
LTENSIFGKLMHTLIGYTSQPTQLQLIAYLGTLVAMYLLVRFARLPLRERELAEPAE